MKQCSLIRSLLGLFFSLVVWGCAAPQSVIVLIPDHEGEVGEILVSNAGGSQQASRAQETIYVRDTDTPPDAPVILEQEDIDKIFGEVLSIEPEQPAKYRLFFVDNTTLTPDSQPHISEIVQEMMRRKSCDLLITGHTDQVGEDEYNLTLSQERVSAVRRLLVSAGVNPECIATEAYGSQFPLIISGSEDTPQPENRRVEVFVK
jgi:outer membrane protein OmpA-like peptidoglycan-associated protein